MSGKVMYNLDEKYHSKIYLLFFSRNSNLGIEVIIIFSSFMILW